MKLIHPFKKSPSFIIPESDEQILKYVSEFAARRKVKLYIVGGYIRDMFLGRQKLNPDIDFALSRGSINFARLLSRHMKCGFVVLDKERGVARLVKKREDKIYTLDFTDFRGATLEEDLRLRDFTLNAMALELDGFSSGSARLIDPWGGLLDLKSGCLKMVERGAFDDDPLRILRAFSLCAIFGFKMDGRTVKCLKVKKGKLSGVSWERIRDEFFKILSVPQCAEHLEQMDRLRVLSMVLPEIELMRGVKQGPYHHLDVWRHTLETVRQLEGVIKKQSLNKQIQSYLDEYICADRRRSALLKLGALLHDVGKPASKRREKGRTRFHGHERVGMLISKEISRRLKLSNDEFNSLRKMVFWHLRPGYLADNLEITPRAIFRYFRDTAQEGVSVLLLSIADQRSTKGPLTCESERRHHEKVVFGLINKSLRRQKEEKPRRFVSGDDLINKFKLTPSPLIGSILQELEELQAIGKIKNKKEALVAAREMILKVRV